MQYCARVHPLRTQNTRTATPTPEKTLVWSCCLFVYVCFLLYFLSRFYFWQVYVCVCVLDVVFHFERMHAKRVVAGRETAAAAAVHNKTVRDFVPTHSILIYYCHEILYSIRVFDASGACTNALVDHVHVCVCL